MSATYEVAVDEIFGAVKAALPDVAAENILWPDVPGKLPDEMQDEWFRVSLQHSTGGNAAIGNSRFYRGGTLFIQVFTPKGEGNMRAYRRAKTVCDAFEGKCTVSDVWFRETRINERQPEDSWSGVNVLVDFSYEEIK